MLHILLTILKIIGIILLVIIGLVLLILSCALFVPIRYSVAIKYKDSPDIKVKVTYLLHIISAAYILKGKKGNIEIKIFGFKLHFFDKEKKKLNEKYDKDTEMFEEMSRTLRQAEKNMFSDEIEIDEIYDSGRNAGTVSKAEKNFDSELENQEIIDKNDLKSGSQSVDESKPEDIGDNGREHKRKSILQRIKDKIVQIKKKIKYLIDKICGTIKNVGKNINGALDFLKQEDTKLAFSFIKGEAVKIFKHVRPRKMKGYVNFGFDDPAITGQVIGILYMFRVGFKKNFVLNPDFENKKLETDVLIKGRVQLYYLLYIALRVYKNKNFNSILKKRRKHG